MRNIVCGLILIMVSTSGLVLAVWRFALLQRYVPFLLRWGGRGFRGFPATKIGVGAGCIVGITTGGLSLYSQFMALPRAVWAPIMGILLGLVIAAAIHDYLLHRKKEHYERTVREFTRVAADDFRQSAGSEPQQRTAICRYLRRGAAEGFSRAELIDFLGVSTLHVLEMAGYSEAAAQRVMEMLADITEEEIQNVDV